jgi:hypothetical protein
MKKVTLVAAIVCLCMSIFAQQNNSSMKYDRLLYQTLSAEEIAKLEKDAPSKLADINFDLTHLCYVDAQLPETYIMANDISTYVSPDKTCDIAEIVASKRINRFHYALPSDDTRYTVCPVGNTGFYVIILPHNEFLKQKREYMKKMGY